MKGAFQTSREIFTNQLWQNVVEFRLFFLIYGNAVFNEEGLIIGGKNLKRGQWLRSYRNLQKDLEYIENRSVKQYSLSRIKRAVDRLIKDERLKIENTELGTLFTVLNYGKYQTLENYKVFNENAERTEREQRENRNGTERERKRNNNNNVKNVKNDKKIKTLRQKRVYDEDSIYYKLALKLYENILVNNAEHKKPNLQKWANDVRLMMEKDNRTEEQIAYLMDWVQNDSFWKSNILSITKLREKFDQLIIKVKEGINKQSKTKDKQQIPRAYQSLQDWAEEEPYEQNGGY